jgi:hypothetical protein
MIEYGFYMIVVATIVVAFGNWRRALYLCVLLDMARDPARKLSESHSVLITQSINLVWLAITVAVLCQERPWLASLSRCYPRLRRAATLLGLALVPGAGMAIVSFASGWQLAVLGAASYLAVIPGIVIGYAFPRSPRDIMRLLTFYCVVNGVALLGGAAEYAHWDWPGLGGIDMTWLRYRPGYTVELISGFYRSPDLLGMHAANVCLFALVLAMAGTRRHRHAWYAAAVWATALLLLAGRRKMMGIPFVFAASFVGLHLARGRSLSATVRYAALGAAAIAVVFVYASSLGISGTYTEYASSIWGGEGRERSVGDSILSITDTVRQSGLLGRGLGSATQGTYHMIAQTVGWQEDGGGKLFVELGVPGVLLFAYAVSLLTRSCWSALRAIPLESATSRVQVGLIGVVAGNVASFMVSHQAYSGDPTSVCLVLLCLGSVLAMPVRELARRRTPVPSPSGRGLE